MEELTNTLLRKSLFYAQVLKEPMAALSRIANGDHHKLQFKLGDTVIFSSSPIPGNTSAANCKSSIFFQKGAEVIHGKANNISHFWMAQEEQN